MKLELYNYLTAYGTVVETQFRLKNPHAYVQWTEENFDYVRYNPRKDVNRWGLSLTSLDGRMNGIPDLDSLSEYNIEHGTKYTERDFVTLTEAYNYTELVELLAPIQKHLFRSHILRINSGGFFPPHRDYRGMNFNSFRIIIPLQGCNPPALTFIVDDKIINWEHGGLYFVDTAKIHYLFNASFEPRYMAVFNVDLNKDTIEFVTKNLRVK